MGLVFKWLIFISSYVPVFIMIFLKSLKKFSSSDIYSTWKLNPIFWFLLLIISIVSIIILFCWLHFLKKESQGNKGAFSIKKLNAYDSEVLNYFVTFIIPILSLDPKSSPSIVMNFLLLLVEGIYFVSNNALYYNVLLILLGYHIYTFDTDNIVVTRKKRNELSFNESKASQIGTTNIFYI